MPTGVIWTPSDNPQLSQPNSIGHTCMAPYRMFALAPILNKVILLQ